MNVHWFHGLTSAEVYDETQTNPSIHDGDVLVVEDELVYGVMVEAWPTAVQLLDSSECAFHLLNDETTWDELDDGKYADAAAMASRLCKEGLEA